MTAPEMEAEIKRLAEAVTYLAAQIERHDREIHGKSSPPPPATGWARSMGG